MIICGATVAAIGLSSPLLYDRYTERLSYRSKDYLMKSTEASLVLFLEDSRGVRSLGDGVQTHLSLEVRLLDRCLLRRFLLLLL